MRTLDTCPTLDKCLAPTQACWRVVLQPPQYSTVLVYTRIYPSSADTHTRSIYSGMRTHIRAYGTDIYMRLGVVAEAPQ